MAIAKLLNYRFYFISNALRDKPFRSEESCPVADPESDDRLFRPPLSHLSEYHIAALWPGSFKDTPEESGGFQD
jgi:hypothetical protein